CSLFFQAEDGIRDRNVTAVQTCALPIFIPLKSGIVITLGVVIKAKITTEITIKANIIAPTIIPLFFLLHFCFFSLVLVVSSFFFIASSERIKVLVSSKFSSITLSFI